MELPFRGHYQDQNRTSRGISSKKELKQKFGSVTSVQWTSFEAEQVSSELRTFTWENSHRREFHTRMTSWLCIAFTWWLRHFMSGLYEGTLQADKIHVRFNYECAIRSSLEGDLIQTETSGHLAFTWYRCQISYRSTTTGLTHAGVTRAGITFCGSITQTNTEPRKGTGLNSRRHESYPGVM